jgi:hypothetical protein
MGSTRIFVNPEETRDNNLSRRIPLKRQQPYYLILAL